ncbi:MAG: hypothetical protein AAF311_07230 [Pseudomonadota bacterium]
MTTEKDHLPSNKPLELLIDSHLYNVAVETGLAMRGVSEDARALQIGGIIDSASLVLAYWWEGGDDNRPGDRRHMIVKGDQMALGSLTADQIGKSAQALIVSEEAEAEFLRTMIAGNSAKAASGQTHH